MHAQQHLRSCFAELTLLLDTLRNHPVGINERKTDIPSIAADMDPIVTDMFIQ